MEKEINKETMQIGFPNISPHRGVLDYFRSRAILKNIQVRSYQWDRPRADPQQALTVARRKYVRTEEALEDKRKVYRQTRQKLEEQWQELRNKELEFKEMFESMNNFITTNDAKRTRARQRFKEDSQLRIKQTENIARLHKDLTSVQQVKNEMDHEIIKHRLFEKYLHVVVEKTNEFKNPLDLIDRYESLVRTKTELGDRQANNMELLEFSKSTVAKLIDDYVFQILGFNNIIAQLNSKYKTVSYTAMHWENLVLAIKKKAFLNFQEIIEVKLACWNIYKMMCKRKGEAIQVEETDLENQLSYIKKTLREMKLVKDEATQMSKKTFSSIKGQTSKVS